MLVTLETSQEDRSWLKLPTLPVYPGRGREGRGGGERRRRRREKDEGG
jgi:hypothetical protein